MVEDGLFYSNYSDSKMSRDSEEFYQNIDLLFGCADNLSRLPAQSMSAGKGKKSCVHIFPSYAIIKLSLTQVLPSCASAAHLKSLFMKLWRARPIISHLLSCQSRDHTPKSVTKWQENGPCFHVWTDLFMCLLTYFVDVLVSWLDVLF